MTIEQVEYSIENVCKKIAPVWPLENSVAVNPFLGLSDYSFEEAATILKLRGNINLYMPLSFYLKYIEEGKVLKYDIEKALRKKRKNATVKEFLFEVRTLICEKPKERNANILSNIVDKHLKSDFSQVMINHISEWMANYFNQPNQTSSEAMYLKWKQEAGIDLHPELLGVINFRKSIKSIPYTSHAAILVGLEKLNVPEDLVETYLHSLLLEVLGWASYCAGLDWQNRLHGKESNFVKELLGIIISWENTLLSSFNKLKPKWTRHLKQLENIVFKDVNDEYFKAQSILQDAFDFSFQRQLIHKLNAPQKVKSPATKIPKAQIVFCIDVRSEVFRRNLELVESEIETLGFAGFFGFPVKYRPINHQKGKDQCPVLIASGPEVFETTNQPSNLKKVKLSLIRKGKLNQSWQKFRTGSISSFSFVSPLGLFFLPKLFSDSFGWTSPTANPKKKEFGEITSGNHNLDVSHIPFEDRLKMAQSTLTSMGLTKQFAPLVLITGHGASSVNNPHASGLDCGACGGNSGEINALTAQLILNDEKIREALNYRGITIPNDTLFVACLHDTTTDAISILNEKNIPLSHIEELDAIKALLAIASQLSRESRAPRLGIKKTLAESQIIKRAKDWAQVRPEWGLAGCSSFIIAPRYRTSGIDLEGKAFLHSYDWKTDEDFKVLESIMTAPMVVTSWINLQYYASTVDNERLGSGNKTLHNVTSNLGVIEGANGDLRIGLPYQSIHDGKEYQHLPLRLNVIIDAPKEAIVNIIEKHKNLIELFENKWINLFTTDGNTKVTLQYEAKEKWKKLEISKEELEYKDVKSLV